MRVLITGAAGQVGTELVEHCVAAGDEVTATTRAELDVTSRDEVLAALGHLRPDVVFNATAWTAVDACEDDPARAYAANALSVRHLAEGTRRFGGHLVHLSTDYVFDGTKATPYDEWDVPNPTSVYGRSKWAGELELAGHPSATNLRISWVCGRHGGNMVKTLLRLADGDATPKFVDDQIGHPTIVGDLVPLLRRVGSERRPGTFHATNQGALSWFDFAQLVFELAGADPERVSAIPTAELDPPRPAPRPANSVLDNAALRASGVPLLRHHRDAVADLVAALRAS